MKKVKAITSKIYILFYILNVSVICAQPSLGWVYTSNSIGHEQSIDIVVDNSGNVYNTGFYDNVMDFDPGPSSYTLTHSGATDAFIQKLDANGNFLWAKNFSGPQLQTGVALSLDAAENIYLLGTFDGQIDFDPGPGIFNMSAISGSTFILKLDPSGNFIWAKQIGGDATAMTFDYIGNMFITGSFFGTADFDPGANIFNLTSPTATGMYIVKLDASGNFLWAQGFSNTSGYCFSRSIKADQSGNIYSSGTFKDTLDFDSAASTNSLASVGPYGNAYMLKLNSSGFFMSVEHINCTSSAGEIDVDKHGNVCFVGTFSGTVDFDPGVGTYTMASTTSTGSSSGFIQKLNALGNLSWAFALHSYEPYNVCFDSTGNAYSAGNFFSGADFDPGPGVYNLASSGMSIQKLSASGNFIWAVGFSGGINRTQTGLMVDASDNIYNSGIYEGLVDFDPGLNNNNFYANANDFFVVKLIPETGVGVKEFSQENLLSVFPNPTLDYLNIKLSRGYKDITVKLADAMGKEIFINNYANANIISVNINNKPGMYFVEVIFDGQSKRMKIIKQ